MVPVILASGSQRRKEILSQIGAEFLIIPSDCEEGIDEASPEGLVKRLSFMKAEDVMNRQDMECLVIGADTVVVHRGVIYGKPKDSEDAKYMISCLQGDSHEVLTGVTLIYRSKDGKKQSSTWSVCTQVWVSPMTEQEITAYVNTGEPSDKAGAYAIQGKFAQYVSEIRGDYYNIVGLPIASLYQEAKKLGVSLI